MKIVKSGIDLGTFHSYSLWYDKLYDFSNGTTLRRIKFDVLKDFMKYLEESKDYSLSSLHVALASLRFLYNELFKVKYKFEEIRLPQIQREIPYSISKEKLKLMLHSIENIKHRTIISLMYSAGLVSSDVPRILLDDIEYGFLKVRDKKNEVIRNTPIGEYMMGVLETYMKEYNPKHFLFEGIKKDAPYSVTSIRKILERAVKAANIEKSITSRHLKYSYVKHLQDEGFKTTDILYHLNSDDPVTIKYYSLIDNERNEVTISPIDSLFEGQTDRKMTFRITNEQAKNLVFTDEQTGNLIKNNPELIRNVVSSGLTSSDILAYSYRKNELDKFRSLLTNEEYFEKEKAHLQTTSTEKVWQTFFESNTWIFGHGLNYIFSTPLQDKKLEQVISGFDFNSFGKRVDGLLKTKGIISSLCFVEIKTHVTPLLSATQYRKESWPISLELIGSIAQIQRTTQKAVENLATKIEVKNDDGFLTGETVFIHQPKSYIIAGSLSEFSDNYGINQDKFSSFEFCLK